MSAEIEYRLLPCEHCGKPLEEHLNPDGKEIYWYCNQFKHVRDRVKSFAHDVLETRAEKNRSNAFVLAKLLKKAVAIAEGFKVTLETVTEGNVECKQLTELYDEMDRFRASLKE